MSEQGARVSGPGGILSTTYYLLLSQLPTNYCYYTYYYTAVLVENGGSHHPIRPPTRSFHSPTQSPWTGHLPIPTRDGRCRVANMFVFLFVLLSNQKQTVLVENGERAQNCGSRRERGNLLITPVRPLLHSPTQSPWTSHLPHPHPRWVPSSTRSHNRQLKQPPLETPSTPPFSSTATLRNFPVNMV